MRGHLSLLAPLPVEGVHPVPFLSRQSQFSGECLGHYPPLLNLDPPGSPATRSLRVSIPRLRKDRKPRSAVDEVMSEGGPTGGVQRSKGKAESGHPYSEIRPKRLSRRWTHILVEIPSSGF